MLYAYQPVEALKGTRASQQISRSDLVQWRIADSRFDPNMSPKFTRNRTFFAFTTKGDF
jgi:hypothetical protein